ncbi:unnamed protein product, partial [Rotaria sordida]
MAKKVWQLIVFQPLQRQVTLTCLQLIKSECQNKEINTQLISAVLQSFVEEIRICDQLEAKTLLYNEKYSDLALLFKLVARVTNATVKLENIVEDHFCPMDIEAIKRIGKTNLFFYSKLYVKTILDNHTKFFKLVRCFLNNDQHFIAALSKACENFINNNTITKATRNTKKSAELLTLYCDALLRQGSKTTIKKIHDIVDFSVRVLSSNSCPFSALSNFVISDELKRTFENFMKFYTEQHNRLKRIYQNLCYCSQFDALDSLLTAREHSYLYIIEYSLQRFDLIVCADRLVKQYPSDNEHKLSTAILLIGNPSIVFMD